MVVTAPSVTMAGGSMGSITLASGAAGTVRLLTRAQDVAASVAEQAA